jgi:hypothetical protein
MTVIRKIIRKALTWINTMENGVSVLEDPILGFETFGVSIDGVSC